MHSGHISGARARHTGSSPCTQRSVPHREAPARWARAQSAARLRSRRVAARSPSAWAGRLGMRLLGLLRARWTGTTSRSAGHTWWEQTAGLSHAATIRQPGLSPRCTPEVITMKACQYLSELERRPPHRETPPSAFAHGREPDYEVQALASEEAVRDPHLRKNWAV